MKKILVIVGPTASGKSDLAVRLAKKFRGEIISADSRQVYKGLNVGTGKITQKEMRGVPHYMLDIADPKKQFSVSEYKKLAENSLRYIVINSKLPIIVGGTGFYVDAVTGRTGFPDVPPNPALRKKLDKKSAEELFKSLKKKDLRRAKTIDPHNKVRLIRALEIIEAIGKVPRFGNRVSKTRFIYIGLKPDDLDKRIYKRLLKRLPGMISEAKKLHKQGLTWKRMYELGLEYRYLSLYLQDKLTKADMVNKLNTAIRQYAKRQMTWFKRNKQIKWFKSSQYKAIKKYGEKN
ncbi:MAG: tRNA (adenosine(37)-N6)-dimethylallyltransferase MiaA [Candidatus Zambryskibacteria bacterium RIFCSPHIGHO2_01_FULL_44_22b]|uniref:tRNA dimethylallyltransferase n=2 Tax=Candidatus Zambryskiibacteriota TaxID=1817925 RepID=A0A1G2T048_9BACT|nr:MAG: tRNA (adenosine(37)-N6)-dimethylallyltransferase MiaA [Candidatus Zambryskibacteria bacterium RIFCSPHIGHO2_01_FULL_44_22b]OHB06360.1 MAG: tRNA (adenosine(37)-N6)-dimethylallyltransferase MiaA [Candidatus Zambryskibacteria bacterium RIFCSPLOWO2_01_FULL_45_43]